MEADEHAPLPTVREVFELPELQAGRPEILAAQEEMDREVRWAHVVAGTGSASLLDGGELVLTTGAGWPEEPAALALLAEQLATAGGPGAAAVVLELGRSFESAPDELIRVCEAHRVPLIVLHREVRFVQITQRVHQRILAAQTEALEARAAVHLMLTELGLNRSPVDYVVERLAETLRAPVVLEDSGHRVVAFAGAPSAGHREEDAGPGAGPDPEKRQPGAHLLAPWRGEGLPRLPEGSARVPVEARGRSWGHLTALPGPAHPAGRRTVLELGAFALALGRLADTEGDDWLQLGSKRMFDALLHGRYRNDTELAAQLSAAGLPLDGRVVVAATLRGTGDFGAHVSLERAIVETALRRAVAPEGRVLMAPDEDAAEPVLLALISLPEGDARISRGADPGSTALTSRLARELEMLVPGPTPAGWRTHLALGAPGRRLRQVVASLEQVRAAGRLPAVSEIGRVTVQLAARQPLAHLVRGLAPLPELQEFVADALGPLIEHDRAARRAGHPGDLLQVLAAYTAHPANRSLAAQRARLSRSVFYQRLAQIEELLGVDLADGETIAALAVALLARPRSDSTA